MLLRRELTAYYVRVEQVEDRDYEVNILRLEISSLSVMLCSLFDVTFLYHASLKLHRHWRALFWFSQLSRLTHEIRLWSQLLCFNSSVFQFYFSLSKFVCGQPREKGDEAVHIFLFMDRWVRLDDLDYWLVLWLVCSACLNLMKIFLVSLSFSWCLHQRTLQ